MASSLYSRVKVATSTTGTGAYILGAAIAGFRDFSVVTNGEIVSYLAEQGVSYEYGWGTFTAPNTLTRTTILGSSNSGGAVSWGTPPTISISPNERDLQSGSQADQLVRLDGNAKILPGMLPDPTASTLGGIKSSTAVANQFVTQINTDGSVTTAAIPVAGASVPGGVTTKAVVANQFLTGLDNTGAFSGAQPSFGNLSGQISAGQLINPTAGALGGVRAKAAETGKFLTSIGTDGIPTSAAIAASDLPMPLSDGSAGRIGEVLTASVASSPGTAIGSGSPATIAWITLTPGDWDVYAQFGFTFAGLPTVMIGSLSLATALDGTSMHYESWGSTYPQTGFHSRCGLFKRVNAGVSLNVYLVVQASFSSSATANGYMTARRAR